MTINDRIKEIIDTLFKGNKRLFSNKIDVSPTVIENIVGSRLGNPSFGVLEKILSAIENINADWLILGKGEMFKENNSHSVKNSSAKFDSSLNKQYELLNKKIENFSSVLMDKQLLIDTQIKLIQRLETDNQRLKDENEILKSKTN